jgi:NitT/TauT family transport system substrate-binding protein
MNSAARCVAAIATAAVLIWAQAVVAEPPPPLDPPVKIRINTAGLTNEAGLYLAFDRGYFGREGLQIELVTTSAANSSSDILTQLAIGELDLATFGMTAAVFNALNRGIGIVGLIPLNVVAPGDRSTGIVVRQDHLNNGRYNEPRDLKDMKIAVLTIGGSGHYNVLRALQLAKLGPRDAELTTLSFPDAILGLANKSLDAAFEAEPFIQAAEARGVARLAIPASETSLGLPSIALFANADFATKHREAVRRFVTALLRGQRDWNAAVTRGVDRDRLLASLQAHTLIKDLERLQALNFPIADPNGGFDPGALDELQQFFVASHAQQKLYDSRRFFDAAYLDYALTRLGRLN